MPKENDFLVMISGKSKTGKSSSLMGLAFDTEGNPYPKERQAKVMYLLTEGNKKLPFPNSFTLLKITDPYQVEEAFEHAQENPDKYDYIIIDSQTFLMDQFESQYVVDVVDTMKGWAQYQQYFKRIIQQHVPNVPQAVVFTAHVMDILNESEMIMETKIPVKGALKANGIESYFSCVISTKRMSITKLAKYENDLLTITEEEKLLGFKHVYQTRLTKETIGERISCPLQMWKQQETFIDNNIALVLQRLHEYYH